MIKWLKEQFKRTKAKEQMSELEIKLIASHVNQVTNHKKSMWKWE